MLIGRKTWPPGGVDVLPYIYYSHSENFKNLLLPRVSGRFRNIFEEMYLHLSHVDLSIEHARRQCCFALYGYTECFKNRLPRKYLADFHNKLCRNVLSFIRFVQAMLIARKTWPSGAGLYCLIWL